MKRLMNYISILLLAGIVFGCTDEQLFHNSSGELSVTGSVESSTRTNYAVGDKAVTVSWAGGDKIGLFTADQSDAMCYQATAEGKQTDFTPVDMRLENEEGEKGDALRQDGGIVALSKGIKAADDSSRATEHQAKAQQPEDGCTDTEVNQVFH